MTLDHLEKQAAALLSDVTRLRAAADQGREPDPDLLRQVRVTADGIKTATMQIGPRA